MNDAIQAITMPKWGLAMDEGTVVAWLAEENSLIETGQEVVEIETTKITNVFEVPFGGPLRRRVAQEGETLPVGALLGLVADAEVSEADLDAFIEAFNANFVQQAAEAEEAAPEAQPIAADGFELYHLRMGTPGAGAAPIILVHGFGGDLVSWLFNQPVLAQDHDVLALDLPGHGRAVKDLGEGGLPALTRALAGYMDALELDKAHLVGHSMGGAVAVNMALQQPQRVSGLTLLAPAGMGPEINMDFIQGFCQAAKRKEMRAALEFLVANPELISRDMINESLKYKRLDGVTAALDRLSKDLFPDGRQLTFSDVDLAGLTVPMTVIWGEADRILPITQAAHLPASAAVHRLPDVGHLPHMEATAEVNRLILSSLEG
ncbi:MAG: acetoin dehydrogenase dihydrolipoyllysine-residue acetyltransferase subunit [Pseudomonadota bacterium]